MAEEAQPVPTNGAELNAAGEGGVEHAPHDAPPVENNAGSLIDDAKVSSECKMFVGGNYYIYNRHR